MNYCIIYRNVQTNETHELEWFVPKSWGWSTESVKECFEQRFNNANILKIEPQPCS